MASSSGENLYGPIDTFVFFDLETTDLIKGSRMPQITELAMVATSRNSLRADKRDKKAVPRILHKLSIPVCPTLTINVQASYMTNLWNDSLEHVNQFDEHTYDLIMKFVERLPGTVCFVAHNGNRFDYPVFLSELERIGKTIPDQILCVDTLPAFDQFYNDKEPEIQPILAQIIPEGRDEVDEEVLKALAQKKSDSSLVDDEWNEALYSVLDEYQNSTPNKNINNKLVMLADCGKDVLDSITNKAGNTECDYAAPNGAQQMSPKSMQAANEKTPESQIIKNSAAQIRTSPPKRLNGARKQLNFGDSKPKNLKLCTLHDHLIGCETENQHCAESDCMTLLRCVCQLGPHFADWADSNALSMNLLRRKVIAVKK